MTEQEIQEVRKDLFNGVFDERTAQRLLEIKEIGMTEVGTAEFGIKGKMSGLYIERVWHFTDEQWRDYMDWAKKFKQ
jgi:hypothetical protein